MNSSPMFGNSYAYAPSPCPEPLYNIRSGTNSLVNLPCCISPQGSSFSNFSPGRRTPDVISSRSLRYHPHHPLPAFAPYPGDIEFRRHATNLFANDGGKEVNGKWLNSELNGQRNIKIHPTTRKERYDGIITPKETSRPQRKAIKLSKNKNIYKGNFSAQNIDNYRQTNYYDSNIIPNHVRNRVMLGNVSAQSIDNNLQTNYDPNAVFNNVPNEVMDKNNFSPQSITKNPPTNYNPNVVPSNTPNTVTSQRKFSAQSIDNNPPTNYYDPNTISYHLPSDVMPKGNFPAQRTDNYPHTNYNPNVIVNCTEVHTLENADLSNYSFEPIFEGKDENGKDTVALLANSSAVSSSAQQVHEGENGAFVNNQNSEIRKDQAVLNNISGNGPEKKKYDFSRASPEELKGLVISEVYKHSMDSLRGTTVGSVFHILEASKQVNILQQGLFCLNVIRDKVNCGEFIHSHNWLKLPNHNVRFQIEKERRAERIAREKESRFNQSEPNHHHMTKNGKRTSSDIFPNDHKKIKYVKNMRKFY